MVTLTLPSEDRRALLRGFWLTLGAFAAAPGLLVAWWQQEAILASVWLAAAALAGSLGFLREAFAWRVYRAWNRRLVRPFGTLAARIVTRICFAIFVVAGRQASRMAPSAPGRAAAAWTPRASLEADAYAALFAAATSPAGATGRWVRDYVRWARQTGNGWSLSLLPFLVILRCLPRDVAETSQANIYTLF